MSETNPYDELAVLQKIGGGDQAAFKVLFEQHRNQLFTYLYKITKSAESAEEIVLDVFLKIWHGRESITAIRNFDGFLYRVAHNKAIDFLRSVSKNPAMQEEVWNLLHEPVSGEDADHKLLLKNTESMIGEAIGQLSPQRQKVFNLHHHQGYTNEEIAQRLNLSKNTVRNHLFASVEFIRKYISVNFALILLLSLLKK